MYLSNTRTIVLISGAFVSHHYWEEWILFFENKGYKVVAPPWLHKNDTTENLRLQNPCSKIGSINLFDLLCYYTEIIEILPEKPILIGHAYGGLIVQLLVQQELASAGICINPFPALGFSAGHFEFYRKIIKVSSLFSFQKTTILSFENWEKLFFNAVSITERQSAYERFLIPESKRVLRDLLFKNIRINFRQKHVPLFFISCGEDKIINSKLVFQTSLKYDNVHSISCYKNIKNQNHLTVLHPEWKVTAEHIAKWLNKIS